MTGGTHAAQAVFGAVGLATARRRGPDGHGAGTGLAEQRAAAGLALAGRQPAGRPGRLPGPVLVAQPRPVVRRLT